MAWNGGGSYSSASALQFVRLRWPLGYNSCEFVLEQQANKQTYLPVKEVSCFISILILLTFPAFLSAEDLQNGWAARQIYLENCAACHGFDRTGFIGIPLVPEELTAHSEAAIRSLTSYGIADTLMPVWSCRLPLKQLRQLSYYLKGTPAETIKNLEVGSDGNYRVVENTKWWRDSKRIRKGMVLFDEYCMGCHHTEIEAFAPAYKDIANKRKIGAIVGQIKFPFTSSTILGYTDQTMPKFELTDDEIKDLGAYVYSFRNSQ